MTVSKHCHLIDFLQTDLAIPAESIALGLRHSLDADPLLPMVLWQYGLITTAQLERVFEWLETYPVPPQLELSC